MADSGVVIPNDLIRVVDTHNNLWDQYDTSAAQASKLSELANTFPGHGSAPPFAPLTPENTPASELTASLAFVQHELENVSKMNAAIDERREQIRKIKSQAQLIVIGIVLLIIVVLVGGGALLVSILS